MKIKIARWKHRSYAEGPRANTTLWVSGCRVRCPGCFNRELWEGSLGQDLSLTQILTLVWKGRGLGDRGVAFVGGEPLDQAEALGQVCRSIRWLFPGHVISVYTGYRLEALQKRPDAALVLQTAHYLIDGPFVLSLADPNLGYRGSSNQRVIDLEASRKTGFGRKNGFSRDKGFHELTLANWDGLVIYDRGTLSGPPAVLIPEGDTHDQVCGKYGLAPSDPA